MFHSAFDFIASNRSKETKPASETAIDRFVTPVELTTAYQNAKTSEETAAALAAIKAWNLKGF